MMSEAKVYTLLLGNVEKISRFGHEVGIERHEVVMKSDYDKLKQAVEKLVRMYGPVNHWEEDNARKYTIFVGDDESTDMGQGDFEQKTTGHHWSNSVDDSNVSGKLAREIAKELGIEI